MVAYRGCCKCPAKPASRIGVGPRRGDGIAEYLPYGAAHPPCRFEVAHGLHLADAVEDFLGRDFGYGPAPKISTPILVLTARDAIPARVVGLDTGADDYVVKPVDLVELAARLRSLVRRSLGQSHDRLCCGAVQVQVGRVRTMQAAGSVM